MQTEKRAGDATLEGQDYYEFLQISPNAEAETIHRVYRFLAGRFHPDNPKTGDPQKFTLLTQAYDVLSVPERRADYDARHKKKTSEPVPLSTSIDFMDSLEGEVNRRLWCMGILCNPGPARPSTPWLSPSCRGRP